MYVIGELGSVPSGPRHGRTGLSGAGKQNFRFVKQLRLQRASWGGDRGCVGGRARPGEVRCCTARVLGVAALGRCGGPTPG